MMYFQHRMNEAAGLGALDPSWGVEIDLRSNVERPGHIHLSHDPWRLGQPLEDWLAVFRASELRGPVILNTKEDGLEDRALELCRQRGVEDVLFLDTAAPTLVNHVERGLGHLFFVRVSRDEPVEAVQAFRGKVHWAWVDCFNGEPLPPSVVDRLRPDFKVCLVSPELHGRPLDEVRRFGDLFRLAQGVCTKMPGLWQRLLGRR